MSPTYDLKDFLNACRAGQNVKFWGCARRDAQRDFGAGTDKQRFRVILDACDYPGLAFEKTAALSGRQAVMIDSYTWNRVLGRPGYVAFYRDHVGWWIKSLHESDYSQ